MPPISYVIILFVPEDFPVCAAAITPEAGPDITVFAASSITNFDEIVPPLPFITSNSPSYPFDTSSFSNLLRYFSSIG